MSTEKIKENPSSTTAKKKKRIREKAVQGLLSGNNRDETNDKAEDLPGGNKTAKTEGQPLPSHSRSSSSQSLTNNPPSFVSTQHKSIFEEEEAENIVDANMPPAESVAEAGMPPVNPSSLKRVQSLVEATEAVNAAAQQRVRKMMYTDHFPHVEGGHQQRVHSQLREHNANLSLYSNGLSENFFRPLFPPDEKPVSGVNRGSESLSSSTSSASANQTSPPEEKTNPHQGRKEEEKRNSKRRDKKSAGKADNIEPTTNPSSSSSSSSSVISTAPTQEEINEFITAVMAGKSNAVQSQLAASSEKRKVQLIIGEGTGKYKVKRGNALVFAAENDLVDMVRIMFDEVSDPKLKKQILDYQLQTGSTTGRKTYRAFDVAAESGHADVLEIFLDEVQKPELGIDIVEYMSTWLPQGWTAFLLSVDKGHIEAVRALLQRVEPKRRLDLTFNPIEKGTKYLVGRCAFDFATNHPHIFADMLNLVKQSEEEIFDLLISKRPDGKMVFHALITNFRPQNSDPEALREILNKIRYRVSDLCREFYKKTGRSPFFPLTKRNPSPPAINVLLSFVNSEDERMGLIIALTQNNGPKNHFPEEGHVGKSALANAAENDHPEEIDAMLSSLSERGGRRLRAIKSVIEITDYWSGELVRKTNSFLLAVSSNALRAATAMLKLIPLSDAVALVREAEALATVPAGSTILASLNNYLLERHNREQALNSAPHSSSSSSRSHGGEDAKEREKIKGEIPAPLSPSDESKSSKAEITATTDSTPVSSSSNRMPTQSTNLSAFHNKQRGTRKTEEREQERERERERERECEQEREQEQPNISKNQSAKFSPLPKPSGGKNEKASSSSSVSTKRSEDMRPS